MARHRRHRRHRYGDPLVSMPKFGRLDIKELSPFGKSVDFNDVAIGAGVGIAGGAAVKYLLNMVWKTPPAIVQTYMQPITSILAGVAALLFMKNKRMGQGIFAGAVISGLTPAVFGQLKMSFPTYFSGYGDPLVRQNFGGLLTASPQPPGAFGGLLTASPQPPMFQGYEDPGANLVDA